MNTVSSTADPGQDFTAKAQQHFSQSQGTGDRGKIPVVEDDWAPGEPSGNNEGDNAEEDEEEDVNEEGLPLHDALGGVNTNDSLDFIKPGDPPPSQTASPSFRSSGISASDGFSTADVLQSLMSHADQASSSGSAAKGKGRAKPTSKASSVSLRPASTSENR